MNKQQRLMNSINYHYAKAQLRKRFDSFQEELFNQLGHEEQKEIVDSYAKKHNLYNRL